MQTAIGLIETKGLVALIEATDAMAKAANVEIIKKVQIGGGFVTTIVQGDVGSVRAAVEAGANAALAVGRACRQPHYSAPRGWTCGRLYELINRNSQHTEG